VLEWFAATVAGNALLSLMFQYEPVGPEGRARGDSLVPDRRVIAADDMRPSSTSSETMARSMASSLAGTGTSGRLRRGLA